MTGIEITAEQVKEFEAAGLTVETRYFVSPNAKATANREQRLTGDSIIRRKRGAASVVNELGKDTVVYRAGMVLITLFRESESAELLRADALEAIEKDAGVTQQVARTRLNILRKLGVWVAA